MIQFTSIKELKKYMGLWNLVVASPLQKAKSNASVAIDTRRKIVRQRFDDEMLMTTSIVTVCDELLSTDIIMKVTKQLPLRGELCAGTEQMLDLNKQSILICKREFTDKNVVLTRVETALSINNRTVNVSAEFYSDGGTSMMQHPDGFAPAGPTFPIVDDATKRIIKRRLLSKVSMIAAKTALA